MDYSAPTAAMRFTLDHIADFADDLAAGSHGELSPDDVASILDEAAKFARERVAPLNRSGDKIGARWDNGVVTQPDGFVELYRDWTAAGWNGVDLPAEWGGMGLPIRLATACMEMWASACMGFATLPTLTMGAADTLLLHADDAVKQTYLAKMVEGAWTATMNLTEPQAGSDLGALRAKAVPAGDGSYRITGQKIFITYGEHSLAENIVHLVLARLPDAPPGTKGISLFAVPKFLVKADGSLGARNDLVCAGVEHKLGIHASPTCTMAFGDKGGAVGWLVGEANRGLNCMFTMMNKARLFTGLQGVSIAERACQQAIAYAQTRRQGRAAGATGSSLIVEHPDVRRNLMTMKALTAAARAIAYNAARAIDLAHHAADPQARAKADELAGLLTPVTKAFCTDIGVEVASLNVQVHGGMGFIEETGAAQHYRDARIAPIYEGTNGIQGIDLVTRKILRAGSTVAGETIAGFRQLARDAESLPELGALGGIVNEAVEALEGATHWLAQKERTTEELLAVATPYLRLFGTVAGGAWLAKGAAAALRLQKTGANDPVLAEALALAQFYAENIAVMAPSLARVVVKSADSLPAAGFSGFSA